MRSLFYEISASLPDAVKDPEKKSILIVEDEGVLALHIENELLHMGHSVAGICISGEKAFEVIETARPDLVLMDIRLQGELDGIETADRISKQYGIPVIYMSAHSDEDTIKRAHMTRPYGYLLKPVNPKKLRVAVEVALCRSKINGKKSELT